MTDTIKTFAAVILMIASLFLLFFGFGYIKSGANFYGAKVAVPEKDIQLMNDLVMLSPAKLGSIEDNLQKTLELASIGVGMNISYEKTDITDENNTEKIISGAENSDRIGRYRDITITCGGDIFVQMYNLKLIYEKYKNCLLIKSVTGDKNQGAFKARVYGRK